jgi:hypothetical protein
MTHKTHQGAGGGMIKVHWNEVLNKLIRKNYFIIKDTNQGVEAVSRWVSVCCISTSPWVQIPAPSKRHISVPEGSRVGGWRRITGVCWPGSLDKKTVSSGFSERTQKQAEWQVSDPAFSSGCSTPGHGCVHLYTHEHKHNKREKAPTTQNPPNTKIRIWETPGHGNAVPFLCGTRFCYSPNTLMCSAAMTPHQALISRVFTGVSLLWYN